MVIFKENNNYEEDDRVYGRGFKSVSQDIKASITSHLIP